MNSTGRAAGRSIGIILFLFCLLGSSGSLSAQSPGRDDSGSHWLKKNFRSSNYFTSKQHLKGKLAGFQEEEFNPVDARVAFDIVNEYMAEEDAGARPIHLWGEDSGMYDGFFKQQDIRFANEPNGKSYFWDIAYLNDVDSLVYFFYVIGTEIVEIETMHVRDIPSFELPPIALTELKSIPENFISSQEALQAARNNGLDSLLATTDIDGVFNLEYSLSGFFFEYPSVLNENSSAFWDVLYDGHTWNPELEESDWVESNFLINATTGELLAKLTYFYGDVDPVEFLDVYTLLTSFAEEELESSRFYQVFGSEDSWLPALPEGKSREWMLVWIDPETEVVDLFFTRGTEINGHETFHLSSIPEEERPSLDQYHPIENLNVGSGEALSIAMENGLSAELDDAPAGAAVWIQYNLSKVPTLFPDLLDENANAFWLLHVNIELYDEQWEPLFRRHSSYLVDATNGDYLGSFTDVSAGDPVQRPSGIALNQNYPNPFNPATTIRWEMNTGQHVVLGVYDLLGQKVATLADQHYPSGVHSISFDASALSSGVYLYRLEAGEVVLNKKMTVIK